MIRVRKKGGCSGGVWKPREPSETATVLQFCLAATGNLLGECGLCQALHGQKVSKKEV